MLGGLVITATVQGQKRDVAIIATQGLGGVEQGVLIEEDHAACLMRIDVHGDIVGAATSCNTDSAFPAGTRISVVRDPADAGRYLVLSPGQDWHEPTAEDIRGWVILGSWLALLAMLLCYKFLLHRRIPGAPPQRKPGTAAGTPQERRQTPGSAALDAFEGFWESAQGAAANAWTTFAPRDVRLRGMLLAVLVIAATAVFAMLGTHASAGLTHDRDLARYQPVVDTILLDVGGGD